MYLKHFKLKRAPFQMKPDDDFLYMSSQHSRALVFMDYAAWNPEGFVIISGEIGSGKTTLVKRLLKNYNGKVNTFHVAYTNFDKAELFHYLAKQANLPVQDTNKVTLLYAINDYLKGMTKGGTPFVMVIDEAQNLSEENLEDIRLLAGLEGPNGPMLRVVLLGQPELQGNINQVPQLRQRVKLFYHLNGLSEEETINYIEYRLKVAGLPNNKLFDRKMMQVIFQYSSGIPRIINKICDALLMCAYADDRKKPMVSDLDEILDELMINERPGAEKPVNGEAKGANGTKTINGAKGKAEAPTFNLDPSMFERMVVALEGINKNLAHLTKEKV